MKKLLIALFSLFSLVLLFSSCETDPPVKKESETTEEGTSVFQLASLPDIGSYESKEKYEYFYDTPLDTFVPSDEYGSLSVYTVQESFTDAFGSKAKWEVYGFMTGDGRIITAPVYSVVTYAENGGVGFYIAQGDESGGTYDTSDFVYTLISADGSKTLDGGNLTDSFTDGFILTHSADDRCRVYSPQFELICEFEQDIALTEGETAMTMNFAGKAGDNYMFYDDLRTDDGVSYSIRVFNAQGKLIKTSAPISYTIHKTVGNFLFCTSQEHPEAFLCDLDGNFITAAPSWNCVYNSEADEYYFSSENADPGLIIFDGDMREKRRIEANAFEGNGALCQEPPYGCLLSKPVEDDWGILSDVAFYPIDGSEPSVYHAGKDEVFYRIGVFPSEFVLRYSADSKKAVLIDMAAEKELLTFDCDPIKAIDIFGEHTIILTDAGELITLDLKDASLIARTVLPEEYIECEELAIQTLNDTILLTCYDSTMKNTRALIDIRTGEVYITSNSLRAQKTEDGYVLCYSDGAYTVTSDEQGKVLVCMYSQED